MFGLRTLGRIVSRTTPLYRLSARSLCTQPPRLPILSPPRAAFPCIRHPMVTSRFSTSIGRFSDEGSVDTELIAKLDSEWDLEKEMKGLEDMPPSIKSYLETGPFKVKDIPGHEEVELVRSFGNETISVEFSISDLNLVNPEMDDNALYEEESEDGSEDRGTGSTNSKSGKGIRGGSPRSEEEDFPEEEEPMTDPSFPAHLSIVIEKPKGGALKISGLAQDGMVILQNVTYHRTPQLLRSKSAENDYQNEGLYPGPEFNNLDEDLQVLFERYLDERGINTALALFIPDYIEYKEQKEYLRWLENVKNFVAS